MKSSIYYFVIKTKVLADFQMCISAHIFLSWKLVCNYTYDKTFYACDSYLYNLTLKLEDDSVLTIEWFECNKMKLNQDKCHLLIQGHKHASVWVNIGSCKFGKAMIKNFLESTLIAI